MNSTKLAGCGRALFAGIVGTAATISAADSQESQQHWAFKTPVRRTVPESQASRQWAINPIDHFVFDRFARQGFVPSPGADRVTLVRRLYLDLIGLPPTPEAADAFVRSMEPDSYERLVDELLASPHYGERWGRHWLDAAR